MKYDILLKIAKLFYKMAGEELWGGSYKFLKEDEEFEDIPFSYYSGSYKVLDAPEQEAANELKQFENLPDDKSGFIYPNLYKMLVEHTLNVSHIKYLIDQGSSSDVNLTAEMLYLFKDHMNNIFTNYKELHSIIFAFINNKIKHDDPEVREMAFETMQQFENMMQKHY